MAPGRAPKKSIFFGTRKRYFPDLPFRGSVGGQLARNSRVFFGGPRNQKFRTGVGEQRD